MLTINKPGPSRAVGAGDAPLLISSAVSADSVEADDPFDESSFTSLFSEFPSREMADSVVAGAAEIVAGTGVFVATALAVAGSVVAVAAGVTVATGIAVATLAA